MTIAVHIPGNQPEQSFYYWCFSGMAAAYPDHHFIFITDSLFTIPSGLPNNVTPHHCTPVIQNALMRYYWYQMKLPAVLERYQANVLFTPGMYCSLATQIPQVMLLHQTPPRNASSKVLWMKRYIRKASAIACTSNTLLKKIQAMYPEVIEKSLTTGKGIHPLFTPQKEEALEMFRQQHTNGNAYMVFELTEKNKSAFRIILKAFTIFKKWQRTSIELVCLMRTVSNQPPIPDFSSYKHRQQVHCMHQPPPEATAAWYAGSYAWIDVDTESRLEEQALCALQTRVPLLSASAYPQIPAEGYLKTTPTEQGIAENMMRIYKDEGLRNQLIHAGGEILQQYSWSNMYHVLFSLASGSKR